VPPLFFSVLAQNRLLISVFFDKSALVFKITPFSLSPFPHKNNFPPSRTGTPLFLFFFKNSFFLDVPPKSLSFTCPPPIDQFYFLRSTPHRKTTLFSLPSPPSVWFLLIQTFFWYGFLESPDQSRSPSPLGGCSNYDSMSPWVPSIPSDRLQTYPPRTPPHYLSCSASHPFLLFSLFIDQSSCTSITPFHFFFFKRCGTDYNGLSPNPSCHVTNYPFFVIFFPPVCRRFFVSDILREFFPTFCFAVPSNCYLSLGRDGVTSSFFLDPLLLPPYVFFH